MQAVQPLRVGGAGSAGRVQVDDLAAEPRSQGLDFLHHGVKRGPGWAGDSQVVEDVHDLYFLARINSLWSPKVPLRPWCSASHRARARA